jgi:hypothetical protein
MNKPFENFDFSDFWDNSEYAITEYVNEYPSDAMIRKVEEEFGYTLPESYIEMMKIQNGGIPHKYIFPKTEDITWYDDYVEIEGFYGIGDQKKRSLLGSFGNKFRIEGWGYPDIGLYICDCPSAGHDMIALDYSECGNDGEPRVVHVDQESDYTITVLAENFETFVKALIDYVDDDF